jgi:arabinose-5-phosphate isomerase
VLSKSGQGDEFESIFAYAHAKKIKTILFCCSRGSSARLADVIVDIPCSSEACLLNLAPTSSTTSMLALGDALAIVASSYRGFSQKDFAQNHPAGMLGKQLLLTVGHIMHSGDRLPLVTPNASFKDIVMTVTTKKLGCAVVVDGARQLLGVITDGDVRRACELGASVFSQTADQLMSILPKTVVAETLACTAFTLMESFNITTLVVVQQRLVVGVVHIHDLVKAGIKGE